MKQAYKFNAEAKRFNMKKVVYCSSSPFRSKDFTAVLG